MKCVHGVRIDKPCPDCEYEDDCRRRGVEPENCRKPPARTCLCLSFPSACPVHGELNDITGDPR